MRIVTFPASGTPDYAPYGGVSEFGQTSIIEGNCVGVYHGVSDATALPNYGGTWPLPVYITQISKTDFKGLFTATEYDAISTLTNTDVNAYQFWDMAQTADNIDMDDPRTQAGLNYCSGMGAITSERLAIILLGKAI